MSILLVIIFTYKNVSTPPAYLFTSVGEIIIFLCVCVVGYLRHAEKGRTRFHVPKLDSEENGAGLLFRLIQRGKFPSFQSPFLELERETYDRKFARFRNKNVPIERTSRRITYGARVHFFTFLFAFKQISHKDWITFYSDRSSVFPSGTRSFDSFAVSITNVAFAETGGLSIGNSTDDLCDNVLLYY